MSEMRSFAVTKEEELCKNNVFAYKLQMAINEAIRYFAEEKGLTCVTAYNGYNMGKRIIGTLKVTKGGFNDDIY